jgi:hypothetical protein
VNIPKRLKIGGRDYDVFYPHTFLDSTKPLYGLHDPSAQTIKIGQMDEFNVPRHPQSITHTFMHEILHAIDNVYLCDTIRVQDNCETIIDQLSEGLLQVIRDNQLDFRGGDMAKKKKKAVKGAPVAVPKKVKGKKKGK